MKAAKTQTAQKSVPALPKREGRSASKKKDVKSAAQAKSASTGKISAVTQTTTRAAAKLPPKPSTKNDKPKKSTKPAPAAKPKAASKPTKVPKVGVKRQGGKTAIGKAASKHGGNITKRLRKH